MDIPDGTVNVIAGFYNTDDSNYSPFVENGFAVTLSKLHEE